MGWFPLLCLVGALGLFVIASADAAARYGLRWAEPVFWLGLLILFVPITLRLAAPALRRRESIALVAVLGLGMYLIKVLHSPLGFTHHDEFLHWRTAREILKSGRLFPENPLLPISPLYSGLENVTTAISLLSGLSIFQSGILVVGLARLIFIVALYLLFEQISGSTQVAGVTSALYMGNPTFLFFGGMFKYESLALPFVAVTLYALVRRDQDQSSSHIGLTVVALLALTTTVVTHHLTTYALVAFLGLWMLVSLWTDRGAQDQYRLLGMVVIAVVMNLTWLVYVASVTVGYLAPLLGTAITEVVRLILYEQQSTRELFQSNTGEVAPLWQRVIGITHVLLILLGIPFGLFEVWRRYRDHAIVIALALVACAYPGALVLRLVGDSRGWEVSHRSSAFLFVALAFLVTLAVSGLWLSRKPHWLRGLPVAAAASVILVGGVIAGWPPPWHLPWPYQVSAATWSIEPQGIAAAEWARDYLGPGNRITTDGTNYMLMGSYGEQHFVTTLSGGVDTSWVFYAPEIGPDEIRILRRGRVRYIIIDLRLSDAPPMITPFMGNDPRGRNQRKPVNKDLLLKFEGVEGISRVFDSGDLVIYDVGALLDAP